MRIPSPLKEEAPVPQVSRRSFLQAGGGTALASVLPGRHFVLAQQPVPPSVPAGNPVRFASIGLGIQGSSLLRAAMSMPQAQCVAVADLYDGRHTLAREIAGAGTRTTRSYHELLDDRTIECVIVAVPDHAHRQVTVDALAAGKDVYCEKPMSHSIADGQAMVQAVTDSRHFVQVGSQRVSSALFLKAQSLFREGAVGDLLQVELQLGRNSPGGAWQYPIPPDLSAQTLDWAAWQGAVPKRPFDPVAFSRWRCFRAYGTGMAGDLMVHLLSGMQCITGINAAPDQAHSIGGIRRWKDGRDMPDVQTTTFSYGEVPVSIRLSQGTETPEVTRILGSKGVLEVSGSAVSLSPQSGVDTSPDYGLNGWPAAMHAEYERQWHAEHDPELTAHVANETTVWHGQSWDDLHPHLQNFFSSVRTRTPPVEDVVFGHHAATACHMANASYFEGKVVRSNSKGGERA
ncbi:Gfo/Idh/MocA family protein [Acidipila sp. EB88]|uniref:Gfo/Idh/MocA family protein n=1 Tax=Acidipila sp. EB88 TaxID=2305226 RepID=UPI000F5F659E|nr:Gfo/Idh/MocA family oxidoreductase [Acidipila sp. EB88]RRA48378.1 gfo/Idh/MocA family oxidoreductase [Acidipila sp. EB88]